MKLLLENISWPERTSTIETPLTKVLQYPLHVAIAGGHEDLVRDLVIGGGCPTYRDLHGSTLLHLAAKLGHDKIATTLLGSPSTQQDFQSNWGLSPLMGVLGVSRLHSVKVLLAAGADLTLRTFPRGSSRSALDFAAHLSAGRGPHSSR